MGAIPRPFLFFLVFNETTWLPKLRSETSDLSKLSFKKQLGSSSPRIHKEPRKKPSTPGSLGIRIWTFFETHFSLNFNQKTNENQRNNIDMPIEPIFSERSTKIVVGYLVSLHMVKTGSGTVIQKKTRNHPSLWHAYSSLIFSLLPGIGIFHKNCSRRNSRLTGQ